MRETTHYGEAGSRRSNFPAKPPWQSAYFHTLIAISGFKADLKTGGFQLLPFSSGGSQLKFATTCVGRGSNSLCDHEFLLSDHKAFLNVRYRSETGLNRKKAGT